MAGKYIDLAAGGEIGAKNATNLHQLTGELPSEYTVTQVDGNRGNDASTDFTARLENRSTKIAERVEAIRLFVTQNADALTNAVNALRESDELSASEAASTTALIDDVAAGKSLSGASAGASAGGAAGTKSYLGS